MPLFQRQIIATLLLCCLAASARAETLRLVTDAWAPYVYPLNGQPTGLDYEVSYEILRRLGFELDLQFMPWKRCLMALKQGHADGILDIFYRAEREAHMLFVDEPLSEIEFVLFFERNRPHPYEALEDLSGLVIGISPGYWYKDESFRTSKLFRREEAPTHEANLGKLVRQRIDLAVNDRLAGLHLSRQLGLQQRVDYNRKVVGHDRLFLALRRTPSMQDLARNFARELRRFKREPTYAQLIARYSIDQKATP